MRRIAVATTVALALIAAGCGGTTGMTGSAADELRRSLTSSAKATARFGTYRTDVLITMSVPVLDTPISITGQGAVDTKARRQLLSLDMGTMFAALAEQMGAGGAALAALPKDQLVINMVMDGLTVYMNMPVLAGQLPGGKTWIKIDAASLAALGGQDVSSLMSQSYPEPSQILYYLAAATGPLEAVGSELLNGVETTHVRTTLDLGQYARSLSPKLKAKIGPSLDQFIETVGSANPTVDAWVDTDGLVRRIGLGMEMDVPDAGGKVAVELTMDLHDFGGDVVIGLPSPDMVIDGASFLARTS